MSEAHEITNLLYRYSAYMAAGKFEESAELFRYAQFLTSSGKIIDHKELLEFWRSTVILYEDGTPKTKPIVANPIIEIDEASGVAECHSQYVVLQSLPERPLSIIAAGRYDDKFERVDGRWRFSFRKSTLDMAGDLSQILR